MIRPIYSKKGALNISFGWLFAIIVGAFILFLAIFATTKTVRTSQQQSDVSTSKQIEVLLDPLESGFEEAQSISISVPSRTRIYGTCEDYGYFGEQRLRTSQESLGGEWTFTATQVSSENKYIFNEIFVEGKKFYVFSKPFEFPFKVADLMYLTSSEDEYCFDSAPEDIEEEIANIGQANLAPNCSLDKDYTKICFNSRSGKCDIVVNYNSKYVEKDDEKIPFYTDSLMYAAIFSDKDIYECQLKRLINVRAKELASIYQEKAILISQRECDSDVSQSLLSFVSGAENFDDSSDLSSLGNLADEIKEKNSYSRCKLW